MNMHVNMIEILHNTKHQLQNKNLSDQKIFELSAKFEKSARALLTEQPDEVQKSLQDIKEHPGQYAKRLVQIVNQIS